MNPELTEEIGRLVIENFTMNMIKDKIIDNTGSGCMVDFYILNDNRCLSLTDECVILWTKYEDFYTEEDGLSGLIASADLDTDQYEDTGIYARNE